MLWTKEKNITRLIINNILHKNFWKTRTQQDRAG